MHRTYVEVPFIEDSHPNIYSDEWQSEIARGAFSVRGARLGLQAGAMRIGLTVYELDRGKRNVPYHAHLGVEEMLIVIRGRPTLRSPSGEKDLEEGAVIVFPPGRDGAHQLINRSDKLVRYLMLSSKSPADLIEYPDSGKISAQAGEFGTEGAIAYMLFTKDEAGYFEGEPD
jgi:uncharacterized cupin superfamily protein